MLETWNNLGPEGQAAVVGLFVTVLFGLARKLRPAWFANSEPLAKLRRTATAILTCGVVTLIQQITTGGWKGLPAFLLLWVATAAMAELGHTVVARGSAAKEQLDTAATPADWA